MSLNFQQCDQVNFPTTLQKLGGLCFNQGPFNKYNYLFSQGVISSRLFTPPHQRLVPNFREKKNVPISSLRLTLMIKVIKAGEVSPNNPNLWLYAIHSELQMGKNPSNRICLSCCTIMVQRVKYFEFLRQVVLLNCTYEYIL